MKFIETRLRFWI